jgi:hypothetical protein
MDGAGCHYTGGRTQEGGLMTDPYADGRSHMANVPFANVHDNPFTKGTDAHVAWERGFLDEYWSKPRARRMRVEDYEAGLDEHGYSS